jgi:hypothetical protein
MLHKSLILAEISVRNRLGTAQMVRRGHVLLHCVHD